VLTVDCCVIVILFQRGHKEAATSGGAAAVLGKNVALDHCHYQYHYCHQCVVDSQDDFVVLAVLFLSVSLLVSAKGGCLVNYQER
jgi:hypothetical protein